MGVLQQPVLPVTLFCLVMVTTLTGCSPHLHTTTIGQLGASAPAPAPAPAPFITFAFGGCMAFLTRCHPALLSAPTPRHPAAPPPISDLVLRNESNNEHIDHPAALPAATSSSCVESAVGVIDMLVVRLVAQHQV